MDLIPQSKIERFLEYSPAIRVIYYYINEYGHLKVLLGNHKENNKLVIPGGRFEAKDVLKHSNLISAINHETLFRELKEEMMIRATEIINYMMEDNFETIGTVIWRYPKTGKPCADIICATECKDMYSFTAAPNNELENLSWFDYFDVEEALYENVALAIQMLYDKVLPTFGPLTGSLNYNEEVFTDEEIRAIYNELYELLN